MRIVKLNEYNMETMQLAEPIMDKHRRVLLGRNMTINPKYMQLLLSLGISYIVVDDVESKGITLEEMMDMPTWMDTIHALQDIVKQFQMKKVTIALIHKLASQLVQEVKDRKVIVLAPSTSISNDLQPFAHAVNVAILSLQIGKQLGYNELQLRDLAIGCLLHDIGKFFTDDFRKHPEVGFQILREIRELNLLAAHVAYQHHESLDGSGYPRGIKGDDWLEYAQICAVANKYEYLTSTKEILPHEAIEMIMALSDRKYPTHIVDAFVRRIPAYPPGTKVRINDNEDYIVTKLDVHIQRPTIRHIATGKEKSLADDPTIFITACLA